MSRPEDPPSDPLSDLPPEPPEPSDAEAPSRVSPTSWDFPLRSEQETVEEEARVLSEAEALLERSEGGRGHRARVSEDPLGAARAALEAAARARGETPDLAAVRPERLNARRDPLLAAQEALERAAEARKVAAQGGPRAAARQAEARSQLEVLRRRLGQLGAPGPSGLDEEEDEVSPRAPGAPRKRRL